MNSLEKYLNATRSSNKQNDQRSKQINFLFELLNKIKCQTQYFSAHAIWVQYSQKYMRITKYLQTILLIDWKTKRLTNTLSTFSFLRLFSKEFFILPRPSSNISVKAK